LSAFTHLTEQNMANNVLPQQFPFTAVAGQPLFKLALILAAINPRIGGVLVSGPRGSAKSTLARALADVMPAVQHASEKHSLEKNSPEKSPPENKNTSRFITLPLGASEESVTGTINLQQVLQDKKVEFQEGLLAKADNGILYVDEVNLLPDHLVDLLLDVSASGVNIVERDGVSHSHSANFILLGTMNPDEGELRPQLQDRFGLSVELAPHYSIEERMLIVRLREQFDNDPENFTQQYKDQQQQLCENITQAQQLLATIECSDKWREHIAHRCADANVDGVRADIIWHRAAVAHAAWQQRTDVNEDDVNAVEELVLAHRRQLSAPPSNKPPTPPSPSSRSSESSEQQSSPQSPQQSPQQPAKKESPFTRPPESKRSLQTADSSQNKSQSEEEPSSAGDWGSMQPIKQTTASVEYSSITQQLAALTPAQKSARKKQSLRSVSALNSSASKKVGVELSSSSTVSLSSRNKSYTSKKIHWFQSLLANVGEWPLKQFRYRPEKTHQPVLHLFLLDTSASTLQNQWFAQAKASVVSIAKKIYLDREQLTVMGFGNQTVEMLLPQRRAPKSLKIWLDAIPAGGGTPLRDVIQQAYQFQQQQVRRSPSLQIKTYLVTDGRTSQTINDLALLGEVVVIDIEASPVKRGKAKQIADVLQAHYLPLTI
jgi:magnesium chelatase subunit D